MVEWVVVGWGWWGVWLGGRVGGGGGGVGGGGVSHGGVGGGGMMGGVIRLSFQSNSNSQKLSLWCKKINHYPPRWICMKIKKLSTWIDINV